MTNGIVSLDTRMRRSVRFDGKHCDPQPFCGAVFQAALACGFCHAGLQPGILVFLGAPAGRGPRLPYSPPNLAKHNLVSVAGNSPRGVSCVHYEWRRLRDRLVIVGGMIGGDNHAIEGAQITWRQVN
jgi:hypothetical protein